MKSPFKIAVKETIRGFKGVTLREEIVDPYNYTGASTGNEHFALGVIENDDEYFVEVCISDTLDGEDSGDRFCDLRGGGGDTFYAGPFVSDETACEAMEEIACDLEGAQS